MPDFRSILKEEGNFSPTGEILDKVLSAAEEIYIKPRTPIIESGRINSNVYIVKEGIIRILHFEQDKEITFGFASPGTFLLSPHSYYMNIPAFLQAETCKTPATVLRISKSRFDSLLAESHELALWMLNLAIGQLFSCERKLYLINGTAKERYSSVLKNRSEIIRAVPAKVIASYLGVTPQYLCRLKEELLNE